MNRSRRTSDARMRRFAGSFSALACLLVWGGRAAPAGAQATPAFTTAASPFGGEIELTPDDGATEDRFGISVALSGDVALIGAPLDDDDGENSGAAYVFVWDGATWQQETKLLPDDGGPDDLFGHSVALSGERALIGAHTGDFDTRIGAAYVFVREGPTWRQEAKLTPADGAPGDDFGISVALQGDLALVGAYRHDDKGSGGGAAYVFVRDGATWHQEDKLTTDDTGISTSYFGRAVSLSGDRALIGADGDDDHGFTSGAAYVFVREGTVWHEEAKLAAADGAPVDLFGISVALLGDMALIGSYQDDGENGIDSGSAYVFVFDGTTWQQEAKLLPDGGGPGDSFGSDVSLSGNRALIAAGWDDHQGDGTGSAYVFVRQGTTWRQAEKLTASDAAANDFFGSSASLSGDVALIGAWGDDDHGEASGAAYVFTGVGTVANEPGQDNPGFTLTAYPNPARTAATLRLTLDRPQAVAVAVYDVLGREVAVLHEGALAAGAHAFALDPGTSSLPAGVYLARATAGPSVRVQRVTLLD